MVATITSNTGYAAFRRGSKTLRTPPSKASTPVTLNQRAEEVSNTGRRIFPEGKEKANRTEMETSISSLHLEIKKCMEVLKTMKIACVKQKNISLDIKNGISTLEESLDKIRWDEKNKKTHEKHVTTKNKICMKVEAATQTEESVAEKAFTKGQVKNVPTKRRPSSPPANAPEEKKRKSPIKKTKENQKEPLPPITIERKEKKNYAEVTKENTKAGQNISPQQETRRNKEKKEIKPKLHKKHKTAALLIKPKDKEKYTDILKEIRSKVNPDDTEVIVNTVRQTKSGDLLLELGANSKNREGFGKILQNILGDKATVQSLEPKITLEIRNLDELTTAEEVEDALINKTGNLITEIQVRVTGKNKFSMRTAIIRINTRAAHEMLKSPSIKIGWVKCRIRKRIEVARCFKCFGFGHEQATCSGVDRKGQHICFNCGEKGHKKSNCKNPPKCYLCEDLERPPALDHIPGSGKCQVFREALERMKTASSK